MADHDALEAACVRATFFLLGRNVHAHPALARREIADGHTVGHHDRLQARGLVVFAADVRASDWNAQEPGDELKLLLGRIDKVGRSISCCCTTHGRYSGRCKRAAIASSRSCRRAGAGLAIDDGRGHARRLWTAAFG